MKLALIQITRPNGAVVLINPGDLKSVTINKDTHLLEFRTSAGPVLVQGSQYMVDEKLRPAIRERYNVVDIQPGALIRTSGTKHPHSVIVAHGPRLTTLIFPRGLNQVVLDGSTVTVKHHGQFTVVTDVKRIKGDTRLFEAVPPTPIAGEEG